MLANSISTLPAFLAYFAVAMAILFLFLVVYLSFTPYREIALIRDGNTAAAVSLSGTLIGFALPVANVIRNSRDLVDLVVWSAVACLVQLSTYLVARVALPHLARDVPAGKTAPALFLAALSIAVGLINAACMQS
jgi:putative membrane protein